MFRVYTGFYDGLVTCTEETYELCLCLIVGDLELQPSGDLGHSWMQRPRKSPVKLNRNILYIAPDLELEAMASFLL